MNRPTPPFRLLLRAFAASTALALVHAPTAAAQQDPDCLLDGLQCVPDPFPPGPGPNELLTFEDARATSFEISSGLPGTAVTADFTGDGRLDVLTLHDGRPFLVVSPAALNLVIELEVPPSAGTITSIAAERVTGISLPVMRGSGTTDVVRWIIGAGGVIDAQTGAQMLDPTGGGSGTPLSDWANATMLCTGDFDGDGTEEITGYFEYASPVNGMISALRLGEWLPDGTIQTVTSVELATLFTSMFATDWKAGIPGDEIGLTMGSRFVVVDETLTLQDIAFLPHNAVMAAGLDDDLGVGAAIVVGQPGAGGVRHDFVQVVRPSTTGGYATLEPLANPGLDNLTAMAVGNRLIGTSDDLILGGSSVYVLQNQSATGSPTLTGAWVEEYADVLYSEANAVPPAPGWMLTGDFDGDGDRDVAASNGTHISISRNGALPESSFAVMLQSEESERNWSDVAIPGTNTRMVTIELRNLWSLQLWTAYTVEGRLFLPDDGATFIGSSVVIDPSAPPVPFLGIDTINISFTYLDPGYPAIGSVVLRGRRDNPNGSKKHYPDIVLQVPLGDWSAVGDPAQIGNARLRPVTDPPVIEDNVIPNEGGVS